MISTEEAIHIIGAGTFGLSTALALKNAGYKRVYVYERAAQLPAQDAASVDYNKIVRSDYGQDTLYQTLAIQSMKVFREWNKDCFEKFGHQLYHETGVLLAGKNDKEKDSYESQSYTSHQKSGYGGLLKRNADIPVEKWPMLTVLRKTFRNGYLNTQGGWADSGRSIKYMIHLCREVGVVFKTGIPVTGIEMKDGSKYFGKIIVAAGAWTPKLVPELSKCMTAVGQPVVHIKLTEESRKELDGSPVWAVLGETGFYGFPPTKEGIVKIARHSDGFTNIKRKETSNSLPNEDSESSTFNEPLPVPVSVPRTEVTNPEIGAQIPLEALFEFKAFIQKHFPIEFQSISSTRMCWYTDSQDGDFFMTRIPGQPDLFVATGGSGHAFKFLPVIGNVMVDVFKSLQTPATQRFAFRDIASSSKRESSRSGGNGTLKNLDSVELASHSDLVASFKIPAKI